MTNLNTCHGVYEHLKQCDSPKNRQNIKAYEYEKEVKNGKM